MTPEQAGAEGLDIDAPAARPAPAAQSTPDGPPAPAAVDLVDSPAWSNLTRREREVARLIAAGLSTRQIAESLVISRATAKVHVKHILRKLGLTSRVQIAVWATRASDAGPDDSPPQ
jgi:non-specific serine/threonine protein kinase